jgi:hypothetical protein
VIAHPISLLAEAYQKGKRAGRARFSPGGSDPGATTQ